VLDVKVIYLDQTEILKPIYFRAFIEKTCELKDFSLAKQVLNRKRVSQNSKSAILL